eukprot:TCONS_00017249-protein
MKVFLILMLAYLPILLLKADSAHDIKILKLQVKALIKMVTDANQKVSQTNNRLTQEVTNVRQEASRNLTRENQAINKKLSQSSQAMSQKLSQTNQDLQALKDKDQTLNGFCKTKSTVCGSCFCVEDFNIPAKFYCDCRAKPARRDCKEHYLQGERTNGLYRINMNTYGMVVPAYCDQNTDGGGWTVVQRRVDDSTNFYRNWKPYKEGFGQIHHEHWLGNDNLNLLTAQAVLTGSEIRFELGIKGKNYRRYAKYSNFHVDAESNAYQLHISGYSAGNLGDRMSYHNGMKWTTQDRDNDKWAYNCAAYTNGYIGAWWYNNCVTASGCSLNSPYDRYSRERSIGHYFIWHPYRLQSSEMKVRRK